MTPPAMPEAASDCKHAAGALRPVIDPNRCEGKAACAAECPYEVFVDRVQVQQVLLNLVRNAIDAMIDSPVRLLNLSSNAGSDGFVTISVEDTGSGISDTVALQLFQPFVTSKQAGMGIGLSICRTIVEAHGGRIWCEAARDRGTIFRFTLPTAQAGGDARHGL